MVSVADQKSQIAQLLQLLNGKRIVYKEVDCSLEENKELRDFYFEKSKIRANYPQVFLQTVDDTKYIGSFAEIEQLNEMCDVPEDILKANNIETLDTVFAGEFGRIHASRKASGVWRLHPLELTTASSLSLSFGEMLSVDVARKL